jgi:glycosyltransferase involved in cell wall biosynthesis
MTLPLSLPPDPDVAPDVSIVVPVYDEEGAVEALAREITAAFEGWSHEILFVDDASRDATLARLDAAAARVPALRILRHTRNAGQSRAIRTGVLAARAPIIVMLDGDGQNDPADAPRLADALMAGSPRLAMIGGERRVRRDSVA